MGIFDTSSSLFGDSSGFIGGDPTMSPLGNLLNLYLRRLPSGLPNPVIQSILNAPSYGEGEMIPRAGWTSVSDFAQERTHPDNERDGPLANQLSVVQGLARNNAPFPDSGNPYGTNPYAYGSIMSKSFPSTYPQSLGDIPAQLKSLLGLF